MPDPTTRESRERYFRGISGRFIALRGAPFSLSPADLALISAWESAGIPLDVVLEGLDETFALRPGKPRTAGKIRALSFCRVSVERAFARYRERTVGGKRGSGAGKTEKKQRAARTEAEEFLRRVPPALAALRPYYGDALELLSAPRPDAEALERLDEAVDAALAAAAGPAERKEAAAAFGRESSRLQSEAKKQAVEIGLVKLLREKFRVPRVSLYYYS
jgi:hypothetical protein